MSQTALDRPGQPDDNSPRQPAKVNGRPASAPETQALTLPIAPPMSPDSTLPREAIAAQPQFPVRRPTATPRRAAAPSRPATRPGPPTKPEQPERPQQPEQPATVRDAHGRLSAARPAVKSAPTARSAPPTAAPSPSPSRTDSRNTERTERPEPGDEPRSVPRDKPSAGNDGGRSQPPSRDPEDQPKHDPPQENSSAPADAQTAEDPDEELARRTKEAAEQQSSLRAAFRTIGIHLKPLRVAMAIGLFLLVISAAVGLAQPMAVRLVLDKLAKAQPLGTAVLILVGLVLLSALCQGGGNFLMQRSAEDVVLSTRKRLIRKLLSVAVPEMRKQEPGDLMARVTGDTALIRQIALSSLVQFVTGTVMVVGSVVMMIILDWVLFLVTLGVVVVVGILMGIIMPRIRRSSQQTQKNVGKMGAELERVLGAYTTVKASAAEEEEREKIVDRMVSAHDSGIRTALWSSLASLTSTLAIQASFLVVLGYGGYRASTGAMEVPTLIAFLLYAMQLSAPVLQLTQAISVFQSGRAALERIAEVDSFGSELEADAGEAPGTAASLGAVAWDPAAQFEGVTFSYPNTEESALSNLTFSVPQRGLTAIVGPSGSGKSSVLRVIEGFYPLDEGRVMVGGRDIVEWDLDQLRASVAYVEQESPTPAADLLGNLTYGLDDVDEQYAREVLERVGLRERFDEADDDAELGHRGAALSGGEKQRLALARALLRKPRLLLLDEATSALDASNEAMIRDVVADISREIAVVVVAHRLSTIRDAGQILVIENGRLRAHGTHEQLVEVDVLYADLVRAQDTLGAEN